MLTFSHEVEKNIKIKYRDLKMKDVAIRLYISQNNNNNKFQNLTQYSTNMKVDWAKNISARSCTVICNRIRSHLKI